MKKFTDKENKNPSESGLSLDDLTTPEAESVAPGTESVAQTFVTPSGPMRQIRLFLRHAGTPRRRDPRLAAILQLIPGAGYIYMWRVGTAILTVFLFFLAYVLLALRFFEFTAEELPKRVTPIARNPEPDIWNWSVIKPETIFLVAGLLGLLILSLAIRTYRAVKLDNLNLEVKSMVELRKARGTWYNSLIYLNYLAWVVIILGLFQVTKDTEVNIQRLIDKLGNIGNYIGGLLNPAWSALWTEKGIMFRARETLEVSIIGTLLGAILAVPLSLLAARNLMGRNPITNVCYYLVRVILSIQRAIPTLFLAIIFVVSVGVGPFPAVLALTLFSSGLMTKLFSEAIESIDWGQVEAIQASGGSVVHVVLFAVVPQVVPYFISHMLYCWEVNVHSAAVLGLVGAGGIGSYVQDAIETYKYPNIGMALLVVIIITMAIDFSSAYIRSRIV